MKHSSAVFLALSFFSLPLLSPAEVKLNSLFGDNMVLQRDATAPTWGTAAPDEEITLTLGTEVLTTKAGADGSWKTAFSRLKPGPALTLTVAGKSNTLVIHNVAIGEVWVTSGQSNMQYQLIDQDEITAPANPDIRYFETPRQMATTPKDGYPPARPPLSWVTASPETRAKMSAVAWYFAKNLNKDLGVPIGIIDSTWGGTPAEPWVSREALDSVPEYKNLIDKEIDAFDHQKENAQTYAATCAAWEKSFGRNDPGNTGLVAGWAAPGFETKGWLPFNPSTALNLGPIGLPDGGAVWLRKTVNLPPEAAGKEFTLTPGSIPGADTVYFNGQEVGSGGWNFPSFAGQVRMYKVPGNLVKAGDNVIAIRLFTQAGRIGLFGAGSKLGLPVSDPTSISNDWLAHVETALPPMTPEATAAKPRSPYPPPGCTPTVNFNGMICPIMPYGIKGVLWYQGESNVAYAYAYRTLLPLLIQSWRERWKQGDFPFYIVQLPNLGNPAKLAEGTSTWAVLRESQLLTWKKVPKTGMTVNIDLGEAMNIHPHNKKDVGQRLAQAVLTNTYGRSGEGSGPIYESMTVEGQKIRLKFSHLGGGLVAKDGPLAQFAVAGSDQKWVAATAEIDGDTVLVSSPDVAAPVAVRYAWAGNPAGCNLFNGAGLPASPFRTDDWPVITQGMWYFDPAAKKPATPVATSSLPTPPLVEPSH